MKVTDYLLAAVLAPLLFALWLGLTLASAVAVLLVGGFNTNPTKPAADAAARKDQ